MDINLRLKLGKVLDLKSVCSLISAMNRCMLLRNSLGASWAMMSMGSWSIVLWNFTVKNAVLSSVKHCVKTLMLSPFWLWLNNSVDTMALKTFKPWTSEYKWSNEMVQMTSLVLMLIRKRPMVVPTTNICGSKKPGTTKYQTTETRRKKWPKKNEVDKKRVMVKLCLIWPKKLRPAQNLLWLNLAGFDRNKMRSTQNL